LGWRSEYSLVNTNSINCTVFGVLLLAFNLVEHPPDDSMKEILNNIALGNMKFLSEQLAMTRKNSFKRSGIRSLGVMRLFYMGPSSFCIGSSAWFGLIDLLFFKSSVYLLMNAFDSGQSSGKKLYA
jgi:hypothetical protein